MEWKRWSIVPMVTKLFKTLDTTSCRAAWDHPGRIRTSLFILIIASWFTVKIVLDVKVASGVFRWHRTFCSKYAQDWPNTATSGQLSAASLSHTSTGRSGQELLVTYLNDLSIIQRLVHVSSNCGIIGMFDSTIICLLLTNNKCRWAPKKD